jgi:hypothetical protein
VLYHISRKVVSVLKEWFLYYVLYRTIPLEQKKPYDKYNIAQNTGTIPVEQKQPYEKYDRGLDSGFWEILKPLKWTNITSFFLTNG